MVPTKYSAEVCPPTSLMTRSEGRGGRQGGEGRKTGRGGEEDREGRGGRQGGEGTHTHVVSCHVQFDRV